MRHPRAVILHGHGHLLGVRLAGHHDLSALARELDRVADQVCQDLGDLFAVTRHRRGGIVEPGQQHTLRTVSANRLENFPDDLIDVHPRDLKNGSTTLHPVEL